MFSKVVVVLAAVAAAVAMNINQCNTGNAQCCNSAEKASSPAAAKELGLLGVVVQDVNVLVGLGCTPISVIGVSSGVKCEQKPLCCEDNKYNGLVNVGCTPIEL